MGHEEGGREWEKGRASGRPPFLVLNLRRYAGLALEEREDVLGGGVGLGEDGGVGLDQDLGAGHGGGFGGEIGVADGALARGDVLEGDGETVDVGLEDLL